VGAATRRLQVGKNVVAAAKAISALSKCQKGLRRSRLVAKLLNVD